MGDRLYIKELNLSFLTPLYIKQPKTAFYGVLWKDVRSGDMENPTKNSQRVHIHHRLNKNNYYLGTIIAIRMQKQYADYVIITSLESYYTA